MKDRMEEHTPGSLYSYNKNFEFLPDYYGRPFVWYDTGYDYVQYKHVRQPWLMRGHMTFFHKDMVSMVWFPVIGTPCKPIFKTYDRQQFMYHLPISYGYMVGDMVTRVTDGKIHDIGYIHWSPHQLYCRPEHHKEKGSWTYSLYIPLPDNRDFEYDPLNEGTWKGLFTL
jgi:hypothetical protein